MNDQQAPSPHATRPELACVDPGAPPRPGPATDAQAIDLLRELVSIPSPSGHELRASTFLACWLATRGFTASVDESGSAVGILSGPPAPGPCRDIVLLGHVDTVAGEIPVRVEHGELWGRGSVDAKGSLATFACAAAGIELPAGVRLIVIGATEEESASSRGARFAAGQFNPSACIIGEPSGSDAVTIGYKGRLLVDVGITRPASHSAGPDRTAVEIGVQTWIAVRDLADRLSHGRERVFDQVQARLRAFNTTSDGLNDRAELRIGLRLPPGLAPDDLERRIRELPDVEGLTITGHEHAHSGDPRSWLAQALTGAIRSRSQRPRLLLKTGTSDMNVVARAWRCPIIAYGPGDSAMDHTPHERLPLAEYLSAIATLREALRVIASHPALSAEHCQA